MEPHATHYERNETMNQQAQQTDLPEKMQQVLAKCWTDGGFKKQMLADPMSTLKMEGVEVPGGVTIKVVENTEDVLYLTIPVKPAELSDDDLENVAGGGSRGAEIGKDIGKYVFDKGEDIAVELIDATGNVAKGAANYFKKVVNSW